jgi:hypothetical protein
VSPLVLLLLIGGRLAHRAAFAGAKAVSVGHAAAQAGWIAPLLNSRHSAAP